MNLGISLMGSAASMPSGASVKIYVLDVRVTKESLTKRLLQM